MKMSFACWKAHIGLENECLNAEVCGDRIAEVRCTCLNYKDSTLNEKDVFPTLDLRLEKVFTKAVNLLRFIFQSDEYVH